MRCATYLYGFVRSSSAFPENLVGVEDSEVRSFSIGRVAAVVGEVDCQNFMSDAPADPTWLIPRALQHERAIAALQRLGPVLPIRFGSLFSSTSSLERWAETNASAIDEYLSSVHDKDEWTIRINLETARTLLGLATSDPEWAMRMKALPVSSGARYLAEKRLAEAARQEARRRAREIAARIRGIGCVLADERLLPLRKPEAAGDEPIFNAAYLVPRAALSSFQQGATSAVDGLDFIRLEFSGPWAPAHFGPSLTALDA